MVVDVSSSPSRRSTGFSSSSIVPFVVIFAVFCRGREVVSREVEWSQKVIYHKKNKGKASEASSKLVSTIL